MHNKCTKVNNRQLCHLLASCLTVTNKSLSAHHDNATDNTFGCWQLLYVFKYQSLHTFITTGSLLSASLVSNEIITIGKAFYTL